MRTLLVLGLAPLLACHPRVDDSAPPDTDSGFTPAAPVAWNYLVYMDGDNNLEDYVTHDLNELEIVGSTADVNVLVLADRIEGYADDDGDWTGSRYYRIETDTDDTVVSSPVAEDLGEVDMGDPAVLAAFLEWAGTRYPADHTALVLWDHGSGWDFTVAPPSIAEDETSGGGALSIAEGDLAAALTPWVDAHDRLDLVGFDACNMAGWEVAQALVPYARTMTAAETTVGWEGYRYDQALAALEADPAMTGATLADTMARTEVEGGEWSHAAIDLDRIDALSGAIDALALALMDQDDGGQWAWDARNGMQGADETWPWYFMDLKSMVGVIGASAEASPEVAAAAAEVEARRADALIGNYTRWPYASLGGLNIYFDPRNRTWNNLYANGSGATWSQVTHWDDYVLTLDTAGPNALQ